MRPRRVAGVALLLVGALASPAYAGHSLNRRRPGVVTAVDGKTGDERWEIKTHGAGFLSVVGESHGLVFVESVKCVGPLSESERETRSGELIAYDVKSGDERWRMQSRPTTVHPGPYHADEPGFGLGPGALVARRGDRVIGLSPTTGEQRWTLDLGNRHPIGGAVDVVLFRSALLAEKFGDAPRPGPVTVLALDRRSGERRWTFELPRYWELAGRVSFAYPAVASGGGVIVLETYDARVDPGTGTAAPYEMRVIDARTGQQLWTLEVTADEFPNNIAVLDSTVVVNAGFGVIGYNARTGTPRWQLRPEPLRTGYELDDHLGATRGHTPVLVRFDGPEGGDLRAYEPDTGELLWRDLEGGPNELGPVSARDEHLVVAFDFGNWTQSDARWVVLDAQSGRELWRREPLAGGSSEPALGRHTVYFYGGCDYRDPFDE